jgi:UDPglucose 6-dehydrogenase
MGKLLNASVFGMGYIGLTTAVFMAEHIQVTCVEINPEKLDMLSKGVLPIYEPGLDGAFKKVSDNLKFTDCYCTAIEETDISFITVGTPSMPDGSQDLTSINSVLTQIGKSLRNKKRSHAIVIKSTMLPGTTENHVIPLLESSSGNSHGNSFHVFVNPEFTREGNSLQDLTNPDKIVIGTQEQTQAKQLTKLYKTMYPIDVPRIVTSYNNAELIKYTQNAFLATKLSFINTLANLCETIPQTDIETISKAISLDPRISPEYLKAGLGYGGSCLPKDLMALTWLAEQNKVNLNLLKAVKNINDCQALRAIEIAEISLENLSGKTVSILGLAFKPDTDDMREAPAIKIIKELLDKGAKIKVYDPKAMGTAKKLFGTKIEYSLSINNCLDSSDCCIIVTEWDEFRNLTKNNFEKMNRPLIIDGRNCLNEMFDFIEFHRIGFS